MAIHLVGETADTKRGHQRVHAGKRTTDPSTDFHLLFRRAVFSWLIADGDIHLKNLLLKTARPKAAQYNMTAIVGERSAAFVGARS